MEIYCRTISGRTCRLEVNPWTTIKEVKRMIKDKAGTPMGFQRIIYAGRQLDDRSTLHSCNIKRWATLHCVGRMVYNQIFVEHPSGDDEDYRWPGSFAALKLAIWDKHRIPLAEQLLSRNGQEIADHAALSEFCSADTLGILIQLESRNA